ncbi:unnamed protein product [Thlaspi arvense]|uniref:Senescence domain-containing protein n=1 Tax=Thlaspi arvense TaxID=13288 RepID=A0AAU9RXK8_THLAR|nr:unnamed protein product [Thlaspi arvense]
MKGVWPKSTKTLSHSRTISVEPSKQGKMKSKPESVKHEVLFRVPMCKVYLMDEGEALELANGDLTILRISDGNVFLAFVVKIGELQWPLTKDEPVVKLDEKNYLFSLPMKDGDPLSYGVAFLDGGNLKTMSKSMLDRVGIGSASVMAPAVRSQAGQAFLAMVPGEVLLASLDAVNRVLDAAEAAEKQALLATSAAATRMVSERYGESAGEATGDVLASAGHSANTAWNVFKIRKALTPSPFVPPAY